MMRMEEYRSKFELHLVKRCRADQLHDIFEGLGWKSSGIELIYRKWHAFILKSVYLWPEISSSCCSLGAVMHVALGQLVVRLGVFADDSICDERTLPLATVIISSTSTGVHAEL